MSKFKQILLAHRTFFGVMGCLVAVGVAGVYWFIVPETRASNPLAVQVFLRYGHSLCWVLLAVMSGLFAVRAPYKITVGFAYGALISYGIFMLTFLITKG